MLRLLLLLECDNCQEVWTAVPRVHQQLGIAWNEEVENLQYQAEQNGWSIHRSQQVCDSCVTDAMAERQIS